MTSKNSHNIKKRKEANDIFITPLELAKKHIDFIDFNENDKWLDPCRNNGSYFNNFPNDNKDWCEILDNKDFFEYDGEVDIIIQNPPYSIMDKWIQKNIELNPRIFSLLIGVGGLTTKRMEKIESAGYGLIKMKILKVWKWYGMSALVVFQKEKQSIIKFDRKIYY
jgi:hypothetical protein